MVLRQLLASLGSSRPSIHLGALLAASFQHSSCVLGRYTDAKNGTRAPEKTNLFISV